MLGPKPWYRKTKFWTAILAAVMPVLNEYVFAGRLPVEAILTVSGSLLAYVFAEGIADSKRG